MCKLSKDLTICLPLSQLSMITEERDRLKHVLEEPKSMKNVGGRGITDEKLLQVADQILHSFSSPNWAVIFRCHNLPMHRSFNHLLQTKNATSKNWRAICK